MNSKHGLSKFTTLFSLTVLAACGGGGGSDSNPSPGGNSCVPTAGSNVAGEPDITGAVTLTPSTVAKGATVASSIPIEAATRSVNAVLRTEVGGSIAGSANYTVTTVAAQTVSVPVATMASAPAGTYRALINLCSGYDPSADCSSTTATGTLISYGELANTSTTFARWVSVKDGVINNSGASTETCLPIPQVVVQ